MKAENILRAVKNILDRDIRRLEQKVADPEEDTLVHGLLVEAKAMRETIKNHEELPDWYGEKEAKEQQPQEVVMVSREKYDRLIKKINEGWLPEPGDWAFRVELAKDWARKEMAREMIHFIREHTPESFDQKIDQLARHFGVEAVKA